MHAQLNCFIQYETCLTYPNRRVENELIFDCGYLGAPLTNFLNRLRLREFLLFNRFYHRIADRLTFGLSSTILFS